MDTAKAIEIASKHLLELQGHTLDVLSLSKPNSIEGAINLSKIISKLSPMLGNMIEFNIVEFLNTLDEFKKYGSWVRQDPGFPDALFNGTISPAPGFEIKAWFPLATEITARFKDSQNHFLNNETYVCLLAWLPDALISGKPQIIDVCIVSGASVAKARDDHYHNPPDYIVLEPEDTSDRTQNLQQTNTNGYKFQGTTAELKEATKLVQSWGKEGHFYNTDAEYQTMLRKLMANYKYRLDTNFAKMDRIEHGGIEEFKLRVLNSPLHGLTTRQWAKLLNRGEKSKVVEVLKDNLDIK